MRYRLKHNAQTEVPRHHVVFDCETVPVPSPGGSGACLHKLFVGTALYWRFEEGRATRPRPLVFRDRSTLWNWILRLTHPKYSLWVWAHNLGFDLSAARFWELIECRDVHLSRAAGPFATPMGMPSEGRAFQGSLCTEDPPCYVHCQTRAGASLKLVDTMNWLPCSLAAIGAALGLDKLPMPGEGATDDDWIAYCHRDSEILHKAVCLILSTCLVRDLGNFRFTAASQSMSLFRHRCYTSPIDLDTDPVPKELERAAYHAPRSEVYFAGACVRGSIQGLEALAGVPADLPSIAKGPVYRLDMNGAYPAVMRDNLYPVRYLNTAHDLTPERLEERMAALGAVADVTCDSGCDPWPCRKPERTLWMTGRVRCQLCGPELLRALRMKYVKTVHKAQFYALAAPFAAFVDTVWSWRQEALAAGDALGAKMAKTIANALHGKFAQRAHGWELKPAVPAPVPWGVWHDRCPDTGRVRTWRAIGWHSQLKSAETECASSFPLIAAYTVAYHRERMRDAASAAGYRDVLYQDADSLHVTHSGYLSLEQRGWISDTAMGKFKIDKVANIAIYHGLKHYQFDAERVCAGLSRKAVLDSRGLWGQTEFLGLDALLNHGMPMGPVSYEVFKALPRAAVPGRVRSDGWVDPYRET